MGTLNKHILSDYADFECQRRLFWELGIEDSRWMNPIRDYKKRKFVRIGRRLQKLGHKYENQIYTSFKRNNSMILLTESQKSLTKADMLSWKDAFLNDTPESLNEAILIESQFPLSLTFFQKLFEHTSLNGIDSRESIPIKEPAKFLRPDILIFSGPKSAIEHDHALNSDGTTRPLTQDEKNRKIAIHTFDIKLTHPDYIKPRHFTQILFYMQSLVYFLTESNLSEYYYVAVNNNGILGHYEHFSPSSIRDFIQNYITGVDWQNSSHLLTQILNKIKILANKAPCSVENTFPNLQPICGRCKYLEDCKDTLGYYGDPTKMDVALLPYVSSALASQLKNKGWNTIHDVNDQIDSVSDQVVPDPLFPEIPKLKLTTEAILKQDMVEPKADIVKSIKIPKYTDLSLIISNEADVTHKRVYTVSLDLEIKNFNAPYQQLFEIFWREWDQWFNVHNYRDQLANQSEERQNQAYVNLTTIFQERIHSDITIDEIKQLEHALYRIITTQQGNFSFDNKKPVFQSNYIYLADHITSRAELEVAKRFIDNLYDIIVLCSFIDAYITVETPWENDIAPSFALFYWSNDIVDQLTDMLGRQLPDLINEPDYAEKLSKLIAWATPSDSHLADPQQEKKIFDLKSFAENTYGFPMVINYTWHGINQQLFDRSYDHRFWTPHFNYLNDEKFYEYIEEEEPLEITKKKKNLLKQLEYKIKHIHSLRKYFQAFGKQHISQQMKVPRTGEFGRSLGRPTYHRLAKLFCIYSKLTSTYQALEALNFRTNYLEHSIGKLQAAKVDYLRIHSTVQRGDNKPKYKHQFELQGISTNVKFSEKDRVLLVPEPLRDSYSAKKFEVTIETMEWDNRLQIYRVITEPEYKDVFTQYREIAEESDKELESDPQWYLFPQSRDYWSRKLFEKEDSLLNRHNLGESRLGFILSKRWELAKHIPYKTSDFFTLPAITIYAPELLNSSFYFQNKNIYRNINFLQTQSSKRLLTNIVPTPDPSQERSIRTCFDNYVSGFIGPPGTGKSQTITALVDEFIRRKQKMDPNGSIRILISGFSYKSLDVLIEKFTSATDENKKPAPVSQLQRIRLRSRGKDPHPDAEDLAYTGTWKLNGKSRLYSNRSVPKEGIEDNFERNFIMFGNASQLFNLAKPYKNCRYKFLKDTFHFDLIVIDEASQLPVDHFLSTLLFHPLQPLGPVEWKDEHEFSIKLKENEVDYNADHIPRIVIVGDHNQLPPVQPVPPPKDLQPILSSLFAYYVEHHSIPHEQLETNYRSNKDIVHFTSTLGFYENLKAAGFVKDQMLPINIAQVSATWLKQLLDPKKIVMGVVHDNDFEIAVSYLEANIIAKIIGTYYHLIQPNNPKKERAFWNTEIGVVAPHNAQGRLIIRKLIDELKDQSNLQMNELNNYLRRAVVSVEKFQGSDRNIIIASIGISSRDQLKAEEEFIYDLTRFNVLTSRAKAKLILLCSQNYLEYLPEDQEFLEASFKIRNYINSYCNRQTRLNIPTELNDNESEVKLFWHSK